MYKKILILFILLFGIFSYAGEVYALDSDTGIVSHELAKKPDCEYVFGDPNVKDSVAYFLNQIFQVFKYAAPILCLVFVTVDFLKAAASHDEKALMKAFQNAGKRIVMAIILFFVPDLINWLFPLLKLTGTCGVG